MQSSLIFILLFISTFSWSNPQTEEQAKKLNSKARFDQLELFNKVLYLVENQYYRKVDTEKLIEGAIKGMMETLDPHSAFLNKDFFQKMKSDTDGEFGGIGLEVSQKDGAIVVVTPIEDSPAFKAGLRPKDKIVEINHESIIGLSIEESLDKMKGKIGAMIHLGVIRSGKERLIHFNLKREIVKVNPVKSELIENDIAYIRLSQFQRRAAESIESSLKKMVNDSKAKGGLKGIILDLRSNPGGLLDQAVDVSSIFLKDGIVVSTEARDPQNKDIRYVKKSGYKVLDVPLAVLINGASASASEIVAGALQDYKRAIIMGNQSFGKGSVQTVAQLDLGTGLKLTIAQYMTPLNRRIQALGITPDIILDEINNEKFNKVKMADRFIREKDLKNYLTSNIETPDDKKRREEEQKAERVKRAQAIKETKNTKSTSDDELDVEYTVTAPKEDFQVLSAAKYLKSISYWELFKNQK